jgi:hypothetical protein
LVPLIFICAQDKPLVFDQEEEIGAQTFRERVYVFFSLEDDAFLRENPNIFFYAAIYQLVNVCVIITSIVLMIVDSAPTFYGRSLTDNLAITIIEGLTIAFFLFDYVVRLLTCPKLWKFVFNPLNIIDLLVSSLFYYYYYYYFFLFFFFFVLLNFFR